ncbi:MAG: hypothetical protein WCT30_09295 [Desulfurivibrionaceae bacterium]|jgi:hypothetical protein
MNISEIGTARAQTLTAPPEKPGKSAAAKEKAPEAADRQGAVEVTLSMKAKLVETLLSVKKETKAGIATQSGMSQRAAGQDQGFDLATLTYNGKPLSEVSQEEAQALIGEDGYFGVPKTAQRLADFVITGGGEDLARLQTGREGVLSGFKEAEKLWGGKLPEISYQTLNKTLELIDARITELNGGAEVTA